MTCEPWPKGKKETALTQQLVDGDVDGADLGPVPHMHTDVENKLFPEHVLVKYVW